MYHVMLQAQHAHPVQSQYLPVFMRAVQYLLREYGALIHTILLSINDGHILSRILSPLSFNSSQYGFLLGPRQFEAHFT